MDRQAQVAPATHVQSAEEAVATAAGDAPVNSLLEVEPLVSQVIAIHPDIRAASAAWRAAAQRSPQEVSLDDPLLGYMLGPGAWGSDEVDGAYTLEASQKLQWPGKRQLRGSIARAAADAAYYGVDEQRLRIAEVTRLAYYDYYLAHRQLAVLAESMQLLKAFREIALSRYVSATGEQQDVLLADVELAELERRRLELNRKQRVARARINTLLLAAVDAPLAPPPPELSTVDPLPSPDELRTLALSQRPDLAAQAARIRAEQHAIGLAYKEFYPDLEVVARYDAFWQEDPLRPMVGMNLNLPIYKQKRWAAVCEAQARLAQEQAELDAQIRQAMFEVEQSVQLVEESRGSLEVYQRSILPALRHNVDAVRASYQSGRVDFPQLVEAQRKLLDTQDSYFQSLAEYHQRQAELDRRLGRQAIDRASASAPLEGEFLQDTPLLHDDAPHESAQP
jgi:outer membrane protein TolC